MRTALALYLFGSVSWLVTGVQLTNIVHETAVSGDRVECYFSEDASLVYSPGFMARCNVPRSFKKKLFFCAGASIARECIKKQQTCMTSMYAVICELVAVPVRGLLIMCGYDATVIEFSWLKDVLSNAYIFYFNQKKRYMEYSLQENLPQYYAFNKYLSEIVPMC